LYLWGREGEEEGGEREGEEEEGGKDGGDGE